VHSMLDRPGIWPIAVQLHNHAVTNPRSKLNTPISY
jgi:hypothetical protein